MISLPMNKSKISEKSQKKHRPYSLFAILFSVFIALLLWFYVQDAEAGDYKKTFSSVSVEAQSLPEAFSVIGGADFTCDITLTGKRSDLNKLKNSDIEAYLDLSRITQSGNYETEISVLLPDQTALYECFPKIAAIFVDETATVSVPIAVEKGGYETAADIVLEALPAVSTVTVKGPKTILETIKTARVFSGELGKVGASFDRNLEYTFVDENGKEIPQTYLVTAQKAVKVSFIVYKVKTVPLSVGTAHGYWAAEDVRYTVTPAEIAVKGEPALMDTVSSVCAVTIDETQVDTTRYTVKISPDKIELPDGVQLAATIGDIDVTAQLSDSVYKRLRMNLSSSHVIVTPPEGELNYKFDIDVINLKLRGKSEFIYAATVDDFYLNIDLSPYATPGERTVTVNVVQTTSTEGKYYPVGTYTVKVNIF